MEQRFGFELLRCESNNIADQNLLEKKHENSVLELENIFSIQVEQKSKEHHEELELFKSQNVDLIELGLSEEAKKKYASELDSITKKHASQLLHLKEQQLAAKSELLQKNLDEQRKMLFLQNEERRNLIKSFSMEDFNARLTSNFKTSSPIAYSFDGNRNYSTVSDGLSGNEPIYEEKAEHNLYVPSFSHQKSTCQGRNSDKFSEQSREYIIQQSYFLKNHHDQSIRKSVQHTSDFPYNKGNRQKFCNCSECYQPINNHRITYVPKNDKPFHRSHKRGQRGGYAVRQANEAQAKAAEDALLDYIRLKRA